MSRHTRKGEAVRCLVNGVDQKTFIRTGPQYFSTKTYGIGNGVLDDSTESVRRYLIRCFDAACRNDDNRSAREYWFALDYVDKTVFA